MWQTEKIKAGKIALNYFCRNCDIDITFVSDEELFCIGINERLVSIDCVLTCPRCGEVIPVWFLVESKSDIYSQAPDIRVLKRTERLTENVLLGRGKYDDFSELLEKADRAYRDELGAGAIVYLRKVLERITFQTAEAIDIETKNKNGKHRPFKEILVKVDKECSIIPKEFSENGYKLFSELSEIVHSNGDDELLGLKRYDALQRLVIGVLDNVKNNNEMMAAIGNLGWNEEGNAME
ncbi:hypothetical protein [Phascolarctobacterium faecium]|jgi:hypothetical protein|uniref:hypothetical protein n=1 Tax=Phascolarctobacterium faecium TaxID=33025 RepID=UPI0035220218